MLRTVDDRMTLVEHLRRAAQPRHQVAAGHRHRRHRGVPLLQPDAGLAHRPYFDVCEASTRVRLRRTFLITDPLDGFTTRMKVSGYGGLVLALPVVLWQVWRFITPGLHANEKRYAMPFILSLGACCSSRRRHRLLDHAQGARVPDRVSPATSRRRSRPTSTSAWSRS